MFEIAILDKNFEVVRTIDDFYSFIWASRYSKCGDFEIVLPLERNTLTYIRRGYYIVRSDSENFGIIEQVVLGHDEDDKERVIVTGRLGESILARRITEICTDYRGFLLEDVLKALVEKNAGVHAEEDRKIVGLVVVCDLSTTERLDLSVTHGNLLEIVEGLCETYDVGFEMLLNLTDKARIFTLRFYKGTDKSVEQGEVKPVIFSDDYDNLLSSQYAESDVSLVTDVLVTGEGDEGYQKKVWSSKKRNTGLDRYEKYIDRHDIVSGADKFQNKFDSSFDTGMDEKFDGDFPAYKDKLDDLIAGGGSGGGTGGSGTGAGGVSIKLCAPTAESAIEMSDLLNGFTDTRGIEINYLNRKIVNVQAQKQTFTGNDALSKIQRITFLEERYIMLPEGHEVEVTMQNVIVSTSIKVDYTPDAPFLSLEGVLHMTAKLEAGNVSVKLRRFVATDIRCDNREFVLNFTDFNNSTTPWISKQWQVL